MVNKDLIGFASKLRVARRFRPIWTRASRQTQRAPGHAKWCCRANGTCGQQSRRGLGDTDGFAFVPHTVAVGTAPLGIGT